MAIEGNIPTWKPNRHSLVVRWFPYNQHLPRDRRQQLLQSLRNSATVYVRKVKSFILDRDNYKCKACSSPSNLQIDHIRTVYECLKGLVTPYELNSINNLQVLCVKCNASKPCMI